MSAPAVLYEKRVGYWFVTRRRTVISSDSRFGIPTEPKRRRVGAASVSLPAIYGTDRRSVSSRLRSSRLAEQCDVK